MNNKKELNKIFVENAVKEIEVYAERIETLNPENIGEVEEEEFKEILKGVDTGLIEQIKKHEIPLFYSELGYFYPFLEHDLEAVDFFEFLESYRQEMRDWYNRELDFFKDYVIMDPKADITDILERLKGGEPLHKILND